MPELPEVEVLARHLNEVLPGRRILSGEVGRAKSVRPGDPDGFIEAVNGARFIRVQRRAKYLLFDLQAKSDVRRVLGHLGMTGRMYVQKKNAPLPKHRALSLELDRGRFVFEDTRYFGRMSLDLSSLKKLGPEPLTDAFDLSGFRSALRRSRQAIKVRLLSPDLVVGVGNIYASESLFRAGILPTTPANRLTRPMSARLFCAIRETLSEAIRLGSTLPLDWSGQDGRDALFYFGQEKGEETYEERLRVYGRAGAPCSECGTSIQRIVQAARSTFFCPRCQRRR